MSAMATKTQPQCECMDTIFQQEWETRPDAAAVREWESRACTRLRYNSSSSSAIEVSERREKPDSLPQEQEKEVRAERMPDPAAA